MVFCDEIKRIVFGESMLDWLNRGVHDHEKCLSTYLLFCPMQHSRTLGSCITKDVAVRYSQHAKGHLFHLPLAFRLLTLKDAPALLELVLPAMMVKTMAMKTTIRLTEGVRGERAIHVSNHSSIKETTFIKIGLE